MMLGLVNDVCQGRAMGERPWTWPVLPFHLTFPCDDKNKVVQKAETVFCGYFQNEASKMFM